MIRNIILILSMVSLLGPSLSYASENGQPSASEVLLLPRWCWGQYNPAIKDTGVGDCGPGMNHYCPALLELNRSYSSREQFRRVHHLKVALSGVEYTLGWMKDYPNCSIRGDVLKTYTRVRSAFVGVGMPIPPDRFSGQWGSPAKPYRSGNYFPKSEERQTEENKNAPEHTQEQLTKPAQAVKSSPTIEENTLTGAATSSKNNQPTESTKIGTPSNPYCRFCPD